MWIRRWSLPLLMVAMSGPLAATGEEPAAKPPEARNPALHAEDVDARRAATWKLRNSDHAAQKAALPDLIELLMKDKDGQVRLAVLDSVVALGPDAEPAIPALVHTLRTDYGGQGKEETHQDYRSALALAGIGKPAVEALRGLLKERKESVRAEVIMALGRIGADAGPAVPDLMPFLSDKSERMRRESSLALGKIGAPAVEPLLAAATSENDVLREWAVLSLGHVSPPTDPVTAAILKATSDTVPAVRAAAFDSARHLALSDEILLPLLMSALRDKEERVRLGAVRILVEHRATLTKLAPELVKLLTGEEAEPARMSAYLLGKLGTDATPMLLGALEQKQSRVDQIAEALSQIGRPIVPRLLEGLKSPEPRVKQASALALGKIRPVSQGTAQALTVGLSDHEPEVKAAFLTSIGLLGPRAAESAPAVRNMLKDESAEIRVKAIDILAHSAPRDEVLVRDISGMLNDAEPKVQRQAIDILRSMGPLGRNSLPEIIAKLGSPDMDVRLAAAEYVGSFGQAASNAVPALGALLDDPSPKIRTIAALTLGKLGKAAQPTFERLAPLMDAKEFEVREAAALALGSLDIDAMQLRPYLAKALRDEKLEVRRAATRSIQRLGPQGALFVPDIILLAENKEQFRAVERLLRRFERSGPDVRSLPELVKQLDHSQDSVRLLAIKFIGLAGSNASDAIPALEKMREHPSAEVRKQAEAASELIKKQASTRIQKDTI
ncbi:HEAT repeat domain-containing protein [Singulisphaera sp. PoT]|uniref:HEAT repeat domain-containing protein n=1 Tax=Singulisphaera sp. PoT TaxID=3411797 RepID=UPI003BF5D589